MKYYYFFYLFFLLFMVTSFKTFAQKGLMAGAAQVDITPRLGSVINGGFLPFYAKRIHDPLYSKAVAFKSKSKLFVLVEVDVTAIHEDLMLTIKNLIEEETQIAPSQLMISATHSHSTGAALNDLFTQADVAYREILPGKILLSVQQAVKNLRPAQVAWGKVDIPKHVSNRRWFMKEGFKMPNPSGGEDKVRMNPDLGDPSILRPAGPTDPGVGYIAIKGLDEKWISVITNYSLHYVGDFADNTISADYFGEIGLQLKEKLHAGEDFVGIMTNGTSGDINSMDFLKEKNYPTEEFAKTKLIAGDITDAVVSSINNAVWDKKAILNYAYQKVALAVRKPTARELDTAKKRFVLSDYSNLSNVAWASKEMFDIYAYEQVMLSYFPDTFYLPVQALQVGDGIIGSLPGEIFAETGLYLKKQVPCKNYFTVCLSNGFNGYIPPPNQFPLGGYETWRARSSCLEEGAIPKLASALLALVNILLIR
jgi:hypothetical protein